MLHNYLDVFYLRMRWIQRLYVMTKLLTGKLPFVTVANWPIAGLQN